MLMDYSKFTVNDFLTDDYFLRWVNQHDPEAEKFWNLFMTLHPETKGRIERARQLALDIKRAEHTEVSDQEIDQLWSGIQHRVDSHEMIKPEKKMYPSMRFGIAASLSLFMLIGLIYYALKKESVVPKHFVFDTSTQADFVEEVNTSENTIRIHLNDGSIVNLAKASSLRYKASYTNESTRHVFLTGEAFFDISKDPKKPFFVHANEVVTKVLGTSFSVKAYRDESSVTVAVKSGKVSVFSPKTFSSSQDDIQSEVNGVVLLPNQQVVYQREQESFDKTLVQDPVMVSKGMDRTDFIFEAEPLPNVFKILQEAYGIEIIFDEDVMKKCYITAPLGSEPLFEKLKIICRTIGASYEIMDSKIVINSTGCQ